MLPNLGARTPNAQLCKRVQLHPNVASVDKLFERSPTYVTYFVYSALAGIQPTLPLDGDNASEGFLLHYGVHGELTPSAPVGGAGRTAGRGDSATVVELFANSGLAADLMVFVDVYGFRSRYSNDKKFLSWKREIARRLAVLSVDMSMVEADSVRILLQLATLHDIGTVHAFGVQAKATMRAADTTGFDDHARAPGRCAVQPPRRLRPRVPRPDVHGDAPACRKRGAMH